MGKINSSKLGQVLIVVLLICIIIYLTETVLPSHHEQLSFIGRRIMGSDMEMDSDPGIIGTPGSKSWPGGRGRRLLTYYKPNGDIFTGPSNSGHGGGHIDKISFP